MTILDQILSKYIEIWWNPMKMCENPWKPNQNNWFPNDFKWFLMILDEQIQILTKNIENQKKKMFPEHLFHIFCHIRVPKPPQIQKIFPTHPQIIPKSSPNHSKIIPKSSPKLVRTAPVSTSITNQARRWFRRFHIVSPNRQVGD